MNIVLIGYRGTGKSVISKRLSQKTKFEKVSLDAEIEKKAGMNISSIVEKYGWDHFRDLEQQVTAFYADHDNIIIDTGGGVILRSENIENLKQKGILFWLQADINTIAQRIKHSTNRPSLKAQKSFIEEIEEVLKERTPLYQACADHIIKTDKKSPAEIAFNILGLIGNG